jgi:hypothetical protein
MEPIRADSAALIGWTPCLAPATGDGNRHLVPPSNQIINKALTVSLHPDLTADT